MKTKILSILALLLMTVTQGAWAQETLTVYDGTGTSQYIPMYGYSFDYYTKSECIIPASELTAMEGGTITAITFYAQSLEGSNTTFGTANQKVFLKEVSETTLSSYSGMDDATVVYDGTLPMPTTSESGYTITFSQGYTYNGGNLLIGIYNAAKGSWRKVFWYGIDNQSSGVSAFGYSGNSLASVSFKAQQFLPKTTFTYNPAPTAVDLGLPSGKKWADMNVGAGSETGYGTYFAWAATASQANYSQAYAPYYSGSSWSKYTGSDYATLQIGDDAATANWGSDWRMPTKDEAQELIDYTDHEWATIGGVSGYKFMKKSDHSVYIFLPLAGNMDVSELKNTSYGFYWTSTLTTNNVNCGVDLRIKSNEIKTMDHDRFFGFSVRPVQMFAGEGTEASPYLIASTTDWNNLSAAVNGGETYSGKYFKMTANVGTVSTTVGTEANPFRGTFDGNGHTLDVNISNSNANTRTAPFAWAGGSAVIKNLHVTGSLTNTARTAGIVGSLYAATAQISNCRVSATISGGTYTSGFSISGGQITNCLFDGKINGTYSTAGFATYVAEGTKITNCLFKPQDGSSIPSDQGCFYTSASGKTPTITNCYYTSTAGGTAQGTDGSGMTAAQLVENLGPSNWKVVDGNAIPKVHPGLSGEGTQDSPYLIASTTDWNNLVSAVNAGETYSGNYFKMTANVGTVSTWMTGTFSGTFDGDGKTLTVGYSNTTADVMCAPFGTLNGATIQNLKVAGSISSNQRLVAGIAALCSSTANSVTNCLVSATINSSYSGNAADGGLVSLVDNGASLNVTGCAFAGKLLGGGSYASGGIVGWRRTTNACTLTDCLYAPASATGSEVWMTSSEGQDGSANFCRYQTSQPAPTLTNCYYTTDFSSGIGLYTAQGLQARSISAGDYVSTLAICGDATATYDVSGITVYSTGISFNDGSTTTFYGGSGQTVSLDLTAETRDGYQFKQYAASQGTLSGQTTNTPTLTMPAASGETLYTSYTATAGTTGYHGETDDYTKLVDNIKTEAANKWMGTFTPGVYAEFNTPTAIVPTGYVITTGGDAASDAWDARSPKTWKLYGKLHEGDSWTLLDDVTNGNLPKANLTDVSYSIANTAAYKYFRYEITAIKGGTELFQLAELQLKGYDAVVISAEYDPTYNATFASGNDNDGWDIDPEQQIEGGTVTVSYVGENKVKSVTVAPKGALTGKFSVSSTKQVQFSKGNLQYDGSAWSFHTNQYDCVFTDISTATGYPMDIFCWGNIDNPAYDGSTGIGTNGVDLSGSSDWGSNTITNGCTGWRTLTLAEWEYLFANHSYGYATVAGQTGVIILPDVFTDPMRNNGSAAFAASTASWTANVYAAGDDWTAMEKAGALFLPAAGGRDGASIKSVGTKGSYWSSTAYTSHGHFITFQEGSAPITTYYSIHGYGKSVRLVKDVE